MQIAVLVKPVPDTTLAKNLDPQTRRLVRAGATVLNPMDEFAIEAALRVREARPDTKVELIALAPSAAKEALRKGIGMGADGAIHIADDAFVGADAAVTVAALAAAIAQGAYDAVFCGVASSDGAGYYVPRMLAARLKYAFMGDVSRIEATEAGFAATQSLEGERREVRASGPVVVTVTKEIGAVRYPSLKGIMAAKSKPLVAKSLADLGLDAEAARPRMIAREVAMRPARQAAKVATPGDPDEAARIILAFMRERGVR